ncbi:S41 family peptidase [Polaromonas sp.]|nr:S41 family peptidase [Candidatus Saccharibacteria bacterium]
MSLENKEGRKRGFMHKLGLIVVAGVIFAAGIGVGDGRLKFNVPGGSAPVANGLPDKLNYSSLDEVYQSVKANYNGKLNEGQITEGLKHGLAASANDPYTVYFTPKEAKDFRDQLNNSFAGIGARLSKDADGNLIIGEAIVGLPADKTGLKKQDIIIEVNGSQTSSYTLDDAIGKIRGPAGTTVKLKIVRDKSQTLDFKVVRENINLPSVTTKTLDGNIGYIQIGSFANDTTELTQKAAQQFKDAGVKGIVLDLRNDPGGLLEAAVNVSSLWLPRGANVLQERRGSTVTQSYTAAGNDTLRGIPTVVLINEGSASASEITAGALHDNKAARLIGTKSYGKGVVQQLINLSDGGQLKVTVASWYRPDGQNINHKGITPDDLVKISDADLKATKDTQLEAAQAYLNK